MSMGRNIGEKRVEAEKESVRAMENDGKEGTRSVAWKKDALVVVVGQGRWSCQVKKVK